MLKEFQSGNRGQALARSKDIHWMSRAAFARPWKGNSMDTAAQIFLAVLILGTFAIALWHCPKFDSLLRAKG